MKVYEDVIPNLSQQFIWVYMKNMNVWECSVTQCQINNLLQTLRGKNQSCRKESMTSGRHVASISLSLSVPLSLSLSAVTVLCARMRSPLERLSVSLCAVIDCRVKTALTPVTLLPLRERGLCEGHYTFLCSTN